MIKRYDYTLLIVEDSKLINSALCDMLSKSHTPRFKIHSAETLAEARDILGEHPVDFIVLDLELPDGTGEELMGYLGATELYERSKVIVLTGSIDKMRRDNLFQLGIIDYLSKDNPVNFLANEIKKSIAQFISHENTRILVVDDSKFFADHVSTVLRNQNYTVFTCLHSTEVYAFLKNNSVNLLLTDLEMPEMNGIELLRQIRKDDEMLDLPIIGISGTTNQDLISKLLKSGANDFLAKPFLIENLLLKVDVTVSLYKKQRKLMELNEYLQDEINRNVEEIRNKDQLLELDNRHAQMGEMVGSLTHQWKQPLHGISLAAEYIRHLSADDHETDETVQTILEQVQFLSDTMEYFRHFFKPVKERERFSILGAFENVLLLLGETYENIDITLDGNEKLLASGYPNEFYQVIINLLNNAQDAFEENHVTQRRVTVKIASENSHTVTTVCDNAGGIPETIMETLFEQYVTTKEKKGTGIGLHLSRSIIEKIGGTVTVHNMQEGACFTITLPLEGTAS